MQKALQMAQNQDICLSKSPLLLNRKELKVFYNTKHIFNTLKAKYFPWKINFNFSFYSKKQKHYAV